MELISDILRKLKNHELRQVRQYLRASAFEYEKVGKLFDLVTRYPDHEEAYYSQKLYGKDPDNTFRVTKSRLKRLLEDVLLNDKSLNSYSAPYINALVQSEKRVLQGEILLGRGAYAAGKNLLFQAIATARKFSLHHEHFRAEMLLHRSQTVNVSAREFRKRTETLLRLNEVNHLVNEAALIHYAVTNTLTSVTIEEKEELQEIGHMVQRIGVIADDTGSPIARYYFYLSQILYLQYNYRYREALEYCELHLKLVQNEPAVFSHQRTGNAWFQITETSLRSADLSLASRYVKETLAFFSREETNYLIVLGTAFRIAYFSKDYKRAEELLQDAFSHPRFEVSKMRAGIWYYNKACLNFVQGRVKEATQALNDATALLSDKMGWNLTYRMMEIMILFEAGHYDLLESRILNLRQYVKRTQKSSNLFRPMTLISMLMEWQKNSLDFRKSKAAILSRLQKLNSYHDEIPFDPSSGELVRLEKWMEDKIKA